MNKQTILTPAKLTWQDSTPVSVSFKDFYFSTDDGLNESRYVFLAPNNIPERFNKGSLSTPFVVAETGFGTGLNFLVTWQAWQTQKKAKRPLHFFSIEKYPLRKSDLAKALANWPELGDLINPLLDQYPPLVSGLHTLEFESGQVKLSLLLGDITSDLSSLNFKADAWFLDGFAPNKNPDMWTLDFFRQIANKSNLGASYASFTSASIVRKSLLKAGFTVEKQEGFGKKREMILGRYLPSEISPTKLSTQKNLWASPRPSSISSTSYQKQARFDVAVIGAGLAGLSTAYELAQQGLKVCIVDKNDAPVTGASGQSQLAMYAKLPSEANKLFTFTVQCLSNSAQFYNTLQNSMPFSKAARFWHQTGLMQLAWNTKEADKQKRFLKNIQLPDDIVKVIDQNMASQKSGLTIKADALWFEKAGWLDPKLYAEALLSSASIKTFFNREIESLSFNSQKQSWSLHSENKTKIIRASYVVVANANDAKRFDQLSHLPTKPLRGQVTSIKHPALQAAKTVICGEGYLCPISNDWHHFGATFDLSCHESIVKESDTQANISGIKKWLPDWIESANPIDNADFHHSVGLRCTTPDYLPIVGKAPIFDDMVTDFEKLRVDANACKNNYGSYYPNLLVNIGHGSKGLFTTPLAAKMISHSICGGLPPCLEEHSLMLSPARFIIKHLIQRRL